MMAATEALWLNRPPPPELNELRLCRDFYHCTPSELDEQELERVNAHIVCHNAEMHVNQAIRRRPKPKDGIKATNYYRGHNKRRR